MKRNLFLLGLTLLLVGLSGIAARGQSNQNDAEQNKTSKSVYDIYGKRLRVTEKRIAERTLKNGRIIAYRQNRREIAALVKALKEDGMTEGEPVLSPKFWMMIKCLKVNNSCLTGGCSQTCKQVSKILDRQNTTLLYCYCPTP